jgi:hypothetical protein
MSFRTHALRGLALALLGSAAAACIRVKEGAADPELPGTDASASGNDAVSDAGTPDADQRAGDGSLVDTGTAAQDAGADGQASGPCSDTYVDANAGDLVSEGPGVPWSSPLLAAVPGDGAAKATLSAEAPVSANLTVRGFGLALPAAAVIKGVEFRIRRSSAQGSVVDDLVRLVNDGAEIGTSRTLGFWQTVEQTVSYGGPTDTWQWPISPATVNSPTFGVRVRARLPSSGTLQDARLEAVQLRVHYCL